MLKELGLTERDLQSLRKSDQRKQAIAWRVRSRTTVANRWVSERLHMGTASAVSNAVAAFGVAVSPKVKRLRKRVERF